MQDKITVGLSRKWYAYGYSVYEDGPENVCYKEVVHMPFGAFKFLPRYLGSVKIFNPLSGVDLYHTLNSIVLGGNKPWIVSAESFLPRFYGYFDHMQNDKIKWGLEQLAKSHCKKIIPNSHAAETLFYNTVKKNGFSVSDFKQKVEVVYNGQRINVNRIEKNNETVRILFVGNDFFRKGGRAVVDAFIELSKKYDNIELLILSTMRSDLGVSGTNEQDTAYYTNKILSHSNINLRSNVSHDILFNRIFPQTDIVLLPTFDDCYPNSNTEAVQAGIPVITSNVFACPEQVEHGVNGYVVDLPLDENKQLVGMWERDLKKKRQTIRTYEKLLEQGISGRLSELIEAPALRLAMSRNALKMAAEKLDYTIRNKALIRIYKKALES